MERKVKCACLFVALAFSACAVSASFSLELVFPDPAAKEATERLRVVAVEPGDAADCQALLDVEVLVGQAGYRIEQELTFDLAEAETAGDLTQVGPGRRLFYVEAFGFSGDVLLRGCSEVEAGGGGPEEVRIVLAWVEVCQPSNGGLEICDGVDNDCDGSTDEGQASGLCPQLPNAEAVACVDGQCEFACLGAWQNVNGDWSDGCECRPSRDGVEYCDGLDNDCDGLTDEAQDGEAACIACASDADCEDPLWCITGTCDAGVCQVSFLPDESACDDGDACTEGDVCRDGQCVGETKDCSDDLECTEDLCLPDGSCSNELNADYCFIAGVCVARAQVLEPGSCLVCNPDVAELSWSLQPTGAACDDGRWCTGTETCDSAGNCLHADVPCQDICMAECDEVAQQCLPAQAGTPCADEFACTIDEVCDGLGHCQMQEDEAVCEALHPYVAQCSPECSSDSSGCIVPPALVVVSCPDGEQPADQPQLCTVQLTHSPEMTPCLTCRVLKPEGDTQIIWNEDFSGCQGTLTDGWNDWLVASDPPECATLNCGHGPSVGEDLSSYDMAIGHSLDLGRTFNHARMCFWGGSSQLGGSVSDAELGVFMDTRRGEAFSEIFYTMYSADQCEEQCFNLEELDPRAMGNPMVSLVFQAFAFQDIAYTLHQVYVEADLATDLSDVVSVGELSSDDGLTYTLELSKSGDGAVSGVLHCSFEGGGGFGMDSFNFAAP